VREKKRGRPLTAAELSQLAVMRAARETPLRSGSREFMALIRRANELRTETPTELLALADQVVAPDAKAFVRSLLRHIGGRRPNMGTAVPRRRGPRPRYTEEMQAADRTANRTAAEVATLRNITPRHARRIVASWRLPERT
jgi:hypothetical protein